MDLLDEIKIDDLDADQSELAECIGLEAYKRLVKTYAGSTITIRMPEKLTLNIRNKKIRDEFNGYNFFEISKKYGLTERQIRNIVSDDIEKHRNKPLENQMTFFD